MAEARDSIRSVDRTVAILQSFSFEKPDLSLREISEETGLPKPTVFRILSTLQMNGLIIQDQPTGFYRLGYELIKLGAISQEGNSLDKVAKNEMKALSEKTGQTCNIYIRDGFERVCIAQVMGTEYIRRYSFLGARYPLYCGAGKLLLAYMDEEQQEEYFRNVQFEKFTENTLVDVQSLRTELKRIAKDGYSVSKGERDPSTAAVAAPLFDFTGKVIAAITISGPVLFFSEENVSLMIEEIKAAARRVSRGLGFAG